MDYKYQPISVLIRSVPMFASLDADLLTEIEGMTEFIEVPPNTEMCGQGTIPSYLSILLKGQIVMSGNAPDGSETVMEIIHPPGHFVLAAVLTQLPYLMTARSVMFSQLLQLPAAGLRALLARAPLLALNMLQTQAQDFRAMVQHVRDLKLRSTAQRLGCYLLALVKEPDAQIVAFRLPFDKGLLAGRLGCRREILSRAFAALRVQGVETRGMRVLLHDIEKLRAFAAADEIMHPVGMATITPQPNGHL